MLSQKKKKKLKYHQTKYINKHSLRIKINNKRTM